MKIYFKFLISIFFINILLLNGFSCRRSFKRRHRRIGSYRKIGGFGSYGKIGGFGSFLALNSFVGYRYFPFWQTSRINRVVYGNATDEDHFIPVDDGIIISEKLSKNKTNESDRIYYCKQEQRTVQTCLEPEEDDSFFSLFSDTWDGLCCENTKSNEYLCCYASLVLSDAFSLSKMKVSKWSLLILSKTITFIAQKLINF